MIKVGNYHHGRPNPNTPWVRIGQVKVFFSYTTPIAWESEGNLFVNGNFYSATTSNHLGILKRMYSAKTYYEVEQDFMEALEERLTSEMRSM